jgi:hypothetical protein
MLLLTLDHQEDGDDGVCGLNGEAEGAKVVDKAYESVGKSRFRSDWDFVRTWLDEDLHVGGSGSGGGVGDG